MWEFSIFEKFLNNCCVNSVRDISMKLLRDYPPEQVLHILKLMGKIDADMLDVYHMFSYQDYHFIAVNMKAAPPLGSQLDIAYEKEAFLSEAGDSTGQLFLCIENGKIYLPGENALEEIKEDYFK